MSPEPVIISHAGAGRGQAMRTALSLCALMGRELVLRDLGDDGPRYRPGLGPGGLACAAAASAVSGGRLKAAMGGEELTLTPQMLLAGEYEFDVARRKPSSAPVSDILETVLLPLSAAGGPSQVLMRGGTFVPFGWTSDEISHQLMVNWAAQGLVASFKEITPGFAPQGLGEAELSVAPCPGLRPLDAEDPFVIRQVGVEVMLSGLPVHLGEQAVEGAQARLALSGLEPKVNIRRAQGAPGSAMLVWAQGKNGLRVAFRALGRRGGRPGALATAAVDALMGFVESRAGLPGALVASLLTSLVAARGVSRVTVDGPTATLQAAVETVDSLLPGTVLITPARTGNPWEIKVMGKGLI